MRSSTRLSQAAHIYHHTVACRVWAPFGLHRAVSIPRQPVTLCSASTASGAIRAASTSPSHTASSPTLESTHGGGSEIIFSANQPAELPDRLSRLSAWTITSSKMGITRRFTFPTFSAAWRFMNIVADECKAKKHHPHWSNLYNEVTVEWTTHKPKGLSIKDVDMAEFCDKTADAVGLKA